MALEAKVAVESMKMRRLGENLNFFQFCAQNIDEICFRASKPLQNIPNNSFLYRNNDSLSVEDQ